ncbi:putative E3 ubiquitin-protein ligase HIP1 [Camellia lanceoleosa]|uniref:E3 ubiquitin-protein ligase HIP1 n=1 Tax=Camellia lanceoleosa TaxID=1840588 RepID=A0ACC0IJ86_9ERIC|nr:putative E3 ubiquitin-protein ligase HIP1 [Camellia lanceoleosa]
MWEVTPEMEALKLAPCAMAAQDEKSDVPNNSCQQVKKLGQNPVRLCAVMLSDTAKFLSNLQVSFRHLISTLVGIIVHEQPLFYEEPHVHENMRLDAALLSVNEIRTSSGRGTVLYLSVVVAALAAEAELAEETEQLQEGVLESGVVVTPTKPKKGKAALSLKSDRSTTEMEAWKLAACAMAAQDEKSDVPDNSCQQVKKLGQNLGCLCAVMLSDTAKFLSNLFGVPCKSYIGLRLDLLLGLFYALIINFVFAFGNGQKLGVLDGIIVHEQPLFYEEPDVHENMRLYVDDMSYEELLTLEDQIGNVSTGLSEEAMLAAVRWHCYLSMKLGPPVEEESCCICQEDYVDGKELGKLNCGHEFHLNCIKQWLVRRITVLFAKRLQWLFERSSGNSYTKSEIICQSVVPVNFSPVPLPSELIP